MPIKSSGSLSFSEIAAEFGDAAPHSMSEFYKGGALVKAVAANANIPTSGAISFQGFYGARFVLEFLAEYIVVAGGGGSTASNQGGRFNGAGGGGYRSSVAGESSGGGASAEAALSLQSGVTYTVTVGAGGSPGGRGGNSSFVTPTNTIESIGGGANITSETGGCGAGAYSKTLNSGYAGTSNQGYSGGASTFGLRPICNFQPYNTVCYFESGGGGGGAGQAGQPTPTETDGGAGGNGVYSATLGYYLAGGGGGSGYGNGLVSAANGAGGGNTANRGGGAGNTYSVNTSGGSGVVVIKTLSSIPQANTVGTISTFISGSSRVYVFYTSGTIAW